MDELVFVQIAESKNLVMYSYKEFKEHISEIDFFVANALRLLNTIKSIEKNHETKEV